MALPSNLLRLRYGDVAVSASSLAVRWEVYHPSTSTIVETGWCSVSLAAPSRIPEAWDTAVQLCASAAGTVMAKHTPNPAIGNYSQFDADLILDSWLSDPTARTLVHPLSGSFAEVDYRGIVDLVNVILARVLPPPTWAWCESTAPLAVRVKCVAVPGATSYNVYEGTTLVGSVPNANWNTLAMTAGVHSLRMAAVKAGVVGIASFPMTVQVAAAGGLLVARAGPEPGAPEPEPVTEPAEPERVGWWQRVVRFFRDPLGVDGA